jgi:hypothetical protein
MISLTDENVTIIREVQDACADIAQRELQIWDEEDANRIAQMFLKADDPYRLFRFVDEMTGHWVVGYRTQDDREWFPILRQMRNSSQRFLDVLLEG